MRVTRKAGKIDALRKAAKGLTGTQSKVGWFASAKYEGGQPVAGIAAVQEFGSPARGIPPRLGIRTVVIEQRENWKRVVAKISRAVANGKLAPGSVMEAIAMKGAGDIAAHITKVTEPPLSMITVELRRRRRAGDTISGKTVGEAAKAAKSAFFEAPSASEAKPLVETGHLLATLSYEYQGTEYPIKGGK